MQARKKGTGVRIPLPNFDDAFSIAIRRQLCAMPFLHNWSLSDVLMSDECESRK